MRTLIFKTVANGTLKRSFRQRRQQRAMIQNGVIVAAAGVLLYLSWPGIQQNMISTAITRNKAIANQTDSEALKIDSDIADERLQSHCTDFIFSKVDPQKMAAISEGLPVVDPVTGRPPGDGSIYCDVAGRTAISKGGRLTDVKVSQNRARDTLIQEALQSKGLRIEAGNPEVRPANVQEVSQ